MATILFTSEIDNQKVQIESFKEFVPNFKVGESILLCAFIDNNHKDLFSDIGCTINGKPHELMHIFNNDYEFKIIKITWADIDVIWVDLDLVEKSTIKILDEIYDIQKQLK